MSAAAKATVLCVDDEPRILEGLKLTLRRTFEVIAATSAAEGLATLSRTGGAAVVVSDMRMPTMDGAAFLAKVREFWPDATRILLTGDTGRDGAVAAVNEGQIFRFLTKPCAADRLVAAIEAGVRQHELVTAERILLQRTVMGSIRALADILGISNPSAFGRGSRLKRLALELAAAVGHAPSWELEAAALLSQIGYVSLPPELAEKAHRGEPLTDGEQKLVAATPKVAQGLLTQIPRLENVAAILAYATHSGPHREPPAAATAAGAHVLMIVLEFDARVSRGESTEAAIASLRARWGDRHAQMLSQLAALQGVADSSLQLREIRLRDVVTGMILMDDLRTEIGTLLVSRGYEVSDSFIERMRNFGPAVLEERVRVQAARSDPGKHDAAKPR